MYQVLARKWRPGTFEGLVGQKAIATTLANAVREDRLAHAYIFAGLRGTGKTTVARILAKCLNCEKGPTDSPCGECAPCVEIAESRALDVLELDAASRTSVDNIRELQEVISYAPARDRYKVLIIDEAHMLSKAAFNALLKTLEEPPPNVIFVLATTEIQKVLPTILSRCQIFEFRRVGAKELTEYLTGICKVEEIEISRPSLERIARAGEGSVRDALSVLERLLAFCGKQVDDESVLAALGAVRSEVLIGLLEALARRDAGGMLRVLDGLVDEGHDLIHFWNELIGALRDLMVQRALPDGIELVSRSGDELAGIRQAAEGLSLEDLNRAFAVLADLEPALKSSTQPRFMFEASLIRLAGLGAVRPIEEFLESLGRSTAPTAASARSAQKKTPVEPSPPSAPPGGAGGLASQLVSAVLEADPMLGAMLEQAAIKIDGDRLELRFDGGNDALARRLQRRKSRELLARHAETIAGRALEVRVEAGPSAKVKGTPAHGTAKPRPEAESQEQRPARPAAASRKPVGERQSLLERAKGEPGVKKLLREFGAQVVDIRPLQAGPEGRNDEIG